MPFWKATGRGRQKDKEEECGPVAGPSLFLFRIALLHYYLPRPMGFRILGQACAAAAPTDSPCFLD